MADTAETAAPVTTVADAAPATPEPAAAESLRDKMERLGWDPNEKHDAVPESLGAKARASHREETIAKRDAKAEPEPKDPAEEDTKPDLPKPKPAEPNVEKRAQLEALIGEMGLMLEDGRVMPAERVALRAERREAQAKLAELERAAMERIEKSTKALEEKTPRLAKLEEFEKVVESGDHEAIAKLAGFESYDKWQEHIIALKSDPAYQRVRALEIKAAEAEKRAREREEAAEKDEAERAARTQAEQKQREQNEARQTYLRGLAETMAKSTDPLIKAMSDDPMFVGAVFRVQQDHWDGSSAPLSVEQAIRTPAKGAAQPLMAELKRLHDKLAPIFGSPKPNEGTTVAAVKAGVGKPAPEPEKKVPRTPQPNKASAITAKKETEQEFKRRWAGELERAAREERAQRSRKPNGAAT